MTDHETCAKCAGYLPPATEDPCLCAPAAPPPAGVAQAVERLARHYIPWLEAHGYTLDAARMLDLRKHLHALQTEVARVGREWGQAEERAIRAIQRAEAAERALADSRESNARLAAQVERLLPWVHRGEDAEAQARALLATRDEAHGYLRQILASTSDATGIRALARAALADRDGRGATDGVAGSAGEPSPVQASTPVPTSPRSTREILEDPERFGHLSPLPLCARCGRPWGGHWRDMSTSPFPDCAGYVSTSPPCANCGHAKVEHPGCDLKIGCEYGLADGECPCTGYVPPSPPVGGA